MGSKRDGVDAHAWVEPARPCPDLLAGAPRDDSDVDDVVAVGCDARFGIKDREAKGSPQRGQPHLNVRSVMVRSHESPFRCASSAISIASRSEEYRPFSGRGSAIDRSGTVHPALPCWPITFTASA